MSHENRIRLIYDARAVFWIFLARQVDWRIAPQKISSEEVVSRRSCEINRPHLGITDCVLLIFVSTERIWYRLIGVLLR
jgi:hypothetical protein